MDEIYKEFEDVISDISCINDVSLTLTDAMKNCIAENNNAHQLLVVLEILSQKTCCLYDKAETLSYKMLSRSSFKI